MISESTRSVPSNSYTWRDQHTVSYNHYHFHPSLAGAASLQSSEAYAVFPCSSAIGRCNSITYFAIFSSFSLKKICCQGGRTTQFTAPKLSLFSSASKPHVSCTMYIITSILVKRNEHQIIIQWQTAVLAFGLAENPTMISNIANQWEIR